ncbi:ATP-grasp ribosomal peptide maturase [Amycolatopsis roodepoortensis]|uniref:ATP-grasp ribosomal peptide maturase n=1 Tax=Amycolatopsis roodepoortensis TaxID=700274 RepID=A0ABR9L2G9_9PSEU|nr:ATP-grasp ribosomal peptide maturase [Amycolatopsis roodepoortensis]MBE1574517.1 ATP-grasp ribosomal peptide maturase [Amycolatopsis roodepoortensis]
MSVLILAEDIDATADLMVRALMDREVVVHRVNTAWFPAQLSVTAELRGERWAGRINTPARVIDLEGITAAWYRSPRAYRFPDDMNPAERAHANLEAKYGLGGVLSSLPVLWVNHPARLADAAYKPVQLVTAARCGLDVPETAITNDPDVVHAFVKGGKTVTKTFGTNTIMEEGVRKISFTRLVQESDLDDLRGLDQTTHLFQRWVPKAFEVRMVVIGDHITAASIHTRSATAYIDWRTDYDSLDYSLIEPPPDVVDGVRRLMTSMGLVYGSLDFVVHPDGAWTFLEINAGGQYGWLEDATGAPLTDQLADLLAGGQP